MSERMCSRHHRPCTCAMGHLYRFLEPIVLYLLKKRGHSYGYELSYELQEHALTDAEIERAALYRTLRRLEAAGNVISTWDADDVGPARRIYRLTARGKHHLQEWATVLDHVASSLGRFAREAKALKEAGPGFVSEQERGIAELSAGGCGLPTPCNRPSAGHDARRVRTVRA